MFAVGSRALIPPLNRRDTFPFVTFRVRLNTDVSGSDEKRTEVELAEIQDRSITNAQEATRLRTRAQAMRVEADKLDAAADRLEVEAGQWFEYLLRLAEGHGKLASPQEVERRTRFDKIRELLRGHPARVFTSDEIRRAIGEPRSTLNSVRARGAMLARRGEVERRARGVYCWKKNQ